MMRHERTPSPRALIRRLAEQLEPLEYGGSNECLRSPEYEWTYQDLVSALHELERRSIAHFGPDTYIEIHSDDHVHPWDIFKGERWPMALVESGWCDYGEHGDSGLPYIEERKVWEQAGHAYKRSSGYDFSPGTEYGMWYALLAPQGLFGGATEPGAWKRDKWDERASASLRGNLVSFVILADTYGDGVGVSNVWTCFEHRRKGFATALLRAVEKRHSTRYGVHGPYTDDAAAWMESLSRPRALPLPAVVDLAAADGLDPSPARP